MIFALTMAKACAAVNGELMHIALVGTMSTRHHKADRFAECVDHPLTFDPASVLLKDMRWDRLDRSATYPLPSHLYV